MLFSLLLVLFFAFESISTSSWLAAVIRYLMVIIRGIATYPLGTV